MCSIHGFSPDALSRLRPHPPTLAPERNSHTAARLLGRPLALAPEPGGPQVVGETSGPAEALGDPSRSGWAEAPREAPNLTLVAPDPVRAEASVGGARCGASSRSARRSSPAGRVRRSLPPSRCGASAARPRLSSPGPGEHSASGARLGAGPYAALRPMPRRRGCAPGARPWSSRGRPPSGSSPLCPSPPFMAA